MTERQKAKIARGVKLSHERRRRSVAMKASWERRRNSNSTLAVDAADAPDITTNKLYQAAELLVGRATLQQAWKDFLTNTIENALK